MNFLKKIFLPKIKDEVNVCGLLIYFKFNTRYKEQFISIFNKDPRNIIKDTIKKLIKQKKVFDTQYLIYQFHDENDNRHLLGGVRPHTFETCEINVLQWLKISQKKDVDIDKEFSNFIKHEMAHARSYRNKKLKNLEYEQEKNLKLSTLKKENKDIILALFKFSRNIINEGYATLHEDIPFTENKVHNYEIHARKGAEKVKEALEKTMSNGNIKHLTDAMERSVHDLGRFLFFNLVKQGENLEELQTQTYADIIEKYEKHVTHPILCEKKKGILNLSRIIEELQS